MSGCWNPMGAIVLDDGKKYEAHQHGINGLALIKNAIYAWSFDGTIVEYNKEELSFQSKSSVNGANCVVEYKGKSQC